MKRAAAAAGYAAGTAAGITVIALGDHFAATRSWTGGAVAGGCLLALVEAAEIRAACKAPRGKRLRRVLELPAGALVLAVSAGPVLWLVFRAGRTWPNGEVYGAGIAYLALLGAACLAIGKVRRRLRWRKYGYSPEARRAEAEAYRLIPRRGAR